MLSMLYLALIIVLVSGLIAYIGDVIGRRMGRKRLSLLGLRPRYTAIVISVGMGMVIAALTLSTTLAVSQRVRDAFFTPLDKLRAQLSQHQQEVEQTGRELRLAESKVDKVSALLDQEANKLTKTRSDLTASQQSVLERQRQLARARNELATVRELLAGNQRNLNDVNAKLDSAQQQYETMREKLDTSYHSLVEVGRQLRALGTEKHRLDANIQELHDQVNSLTEQANVLNQFARVGFAPLTFTAGQEILAGIMPYCATPERREAWLSKFFVAAENVIRQRSPDMPKDAAALIFIRETENMPERMARKDAIHEIALRMSLLPRDVGVIVRLMPVNNVPENGPALITMESVDLIPDYDTFGNGNAVERITISVTSETTLGDVLGFLVDDLLRQRVPAALREKGMVMMTRRFDAGDPRNPIESSVSLVSWTDLVTAGEQVLSHRGKKVTVVARTRGMVKRSGPITLYFEVTSTD